MNREYNKLASRQFLSKKAMKRMEYLQQWHDHPQYGICASGWCSMPELHGPYREIARMAKAEADTIKENFPFEG